VRAFVTKRSTDIFLLDFVEKAKGYQNQSCSPSNSEGRDYRRRECEVRPANRKISLQERPMPLCVTDLPGRF